MGCLSSAWRRVILARSDADEPAPNTWHPFVAAQALFGPLSPADVADLTDLSPMLAAWCPLPLTWTRQDSV